MLIKNRNFYLYFAWTTSFLATLGSLYFSEVKDFLPCILCWYQRIMMYPLVLVLGVGLLLKDQNAHKYGLPLSLVGLAVAIYQNLLYYNFLPNELVCNVGVSCTTKYIDWFGFVTIPMLSMLGFIVITLSLIIYGRLKDEQGT